MLYEIKTTVVFDKWLKKLKDRSAKIRILARIDRVSHGNFGDIKEIDNPLTEMRFFFWFGLSYLLCHPRKYHCVAIEWWR